MAEINEVPLNEQDWEESLTMIPEQKSDAFHRIQRPQFKLRYWFVWLTKLLNHTEISEVGEIHNIFANQHQKQPLKIPASGRNLIEPVSTHYCKYSKIESPLNKQIPNMNHCIPHTSPGEVE